MGVRRPLLLTLPLLLGATLVPAYAEGRAGDPREAIGIEVLSNRADLVAGGDALIEVDLPAGADASALRLDLDGRDVTDTVALRPNGELQGLLTGLDVGENTLTATLRDGRASRLTITNHPISGPVFAGPQISPWTCTGESLDEHCNRAPTYAFLYKSTRGGSLRAYDPDNPPTDVATTTTSEGETVPFIVRQETGVIARDQYRVAVLYDPEQPWEPWAPQTGWNDKLVLTHGSSCGISFSMGSAPDVLLEDALSRGFLVASHALDHAGHNCNIVTQAESLVMTKEHVIENYGPLRFTIGSGCSGGSLTQQQVANAYPGLYQGITPACSFTDSWSSSMQKEDYKLLRAYFENPRAWDPAAAWTPAQMASIYGHPNISNPVTFTTVIPNNHDPSRSCPGLASALVYHPQDNPDGVRCTLADYMVNVFGKRPDGKAGKPFDNTGIQYGLNGLRQGLITPTQFVDINTKVGSRDIDDEYQEQRTEADRPALARAYRSGAVNSGTHMDEVAIIDLRGPDPGVFHDVYRTYSMRERLQREHGTAANQVLWRGQVAIFGDTTFEDASIVAMDRWLETVESDERDVPLSQKILDARRTAGIVDRCTDGRGSDIPALVCDQTVESYGTPRFEAGMPLADDTLKCQLKPLVRADYPVTFTDAQWEALEQAFPTGVCDYDRPSVDRHDTLAWMTYADTVGGEPMAPAPVATPLRGRGSARR